MVLRTGHSKGKKTFRCFDGLRACALAGPPRRSHTFSVLSSEPETTRLPSGVIALTFISRPCKLPAPVISNVGAKPMSKITRRDFINGSLILGVASVLPFGRTIQTVFAKLDPSNYPPSLTGLRGSHPGSSIHAHSRAWNKKSDWGPTTNLKEEYDLVVVGGGISGLSAAYF